MLASDCRAKSYFAVTSIDKTTVSYEAASVGNPRELTHSLGYSFPADAELTTVETHVYFVRETTGGSPALWRRAGARPPEEIAQGVNDMQLQFGVDSDGDGAVDAYLSAEKVSRWKNVRTVLIDLSVQASASAVSDVSRRDIRQQGIAERTRMAEVFTAAVTLRNAVLAQ
jgi:type IV pilus assembly protein PilW